MTHQELDQIQETNENVALWQEEDDPTSVVDEDGQPWMVGWLNGVRVKRRLLFKYSTIH